MNTTQIDERSIWVVRIFKVNKLRISGEPGKRRSDSRTNLERRLIAGLIGGAPAELANRDGGGAFVG